MISYDICLCLTYFAWYDNLQVCPYFCKWHYFIIYGWVILHCIYVHSSPATPSFPCLQSLPASGSFAVSWLFTSDDQSTGASASASVLPVNAQGWFLLGLAVLISLQSKGPSSVFSSTIWHHQFFSAQPSLWSNSHIHMWLLGKLALTIRTIVSKFISIHFNMLSRFVIVLLPRSKHLLISCLRSPSAVILEPKKRKSYTISTFPPCICHEVMGLDAVILVFWVLSLSQLFHSPLSPSSRGSLGHLHFLPLEWYYLHYLRFLIFLPAILIPVCDLSSLAFHMMCSA